MRFKIIGRREDEQRRWPGYVLGRMRTSTLVLIVAFCALWWVYETYSPAPEPAPTPSSQVVPPGFVPDPAYTWVPRTKVETPWTPTPTTTTTTTATTTTPPPEPTDDTDAPTPDGVEPSGPGVPPTPVTTTPAPNPLFPAPPATTPVMPGPVPSPTLPRAE